ncbi:type IV pilus biogenesis protein PilM [Cupriavidus necator]|uniref:type IV pilus biogenesis protein PilM n=1 Tax=Cupriavidus necator TaxID=106590 RepID=UPI003ECD543A
MRFMLPSVVFALLTGLVAVYRYQSATITPQTQVLQATQSGQTFVAYANAVAAFLNANPSFVGSVSAAQLAAQRTPFSTTFLASASNAVTAFGTAGRTVTTYALLPPGAINTIVSLTGGDAAYGLSSGTTWTSVAPGASAQTLATAVPNGSVVSVIQIGQ